MIDKCIICKSKLKTKQKICANQDCRFFGHPKDYVLKQMKRDFIIKTQKRDSPKDPPVTKKTKTEDLVKSDSDSDDVLITSSSHPLPEWKRELQELDKRKDESTQKIFEEEKNLDEIEERQCEILRSIFKVVYRVRMTGKTLYYTNKEYAIEKSKQTQIENTMKAVATESLSTSEVLKIEY